MRNFINLMLIMWGLVFVNHLSRSEKKVYISMCTLFALNKDSNELRLLSLVEDEMSKLRNFSCG